jgi:hypothetical protein
MCSRVEVYIMSDKINRELEKGMTKAIVGLKELQREQAEKQDKKHWSKLDVPFSLQEGLSKYTKYELDEIRKSLQIKGASSLKKAELIALLDEKIPAMLKEICSLLDEEGFSLLTNMAVNGGYIIAPKLERHQIEYFRASGLIYTGIFKGKKILSVPAELIEPLKFLEKNVEVKSITSRNTEWIKLTSGLLYYYGALSIWEIVEFLESYTQEKLDIHAYLEVMYNGDPINKGISVNEDGFSNIRVVDPSRVKQEHQMRKSVPFFPFTKEQLLKAGEPGFVDRNSSYVQLVDYITKNYKINRVEADSIVEECVYATRIVESPNPIMQYLAERFEFESLEEVKALMDKLVYLMNNTRKWSLKGHTSTELGNQKRKSLLPLPQTMSNQSHNKSDEKIGRNEPCPCGSNKKYKKCCGR